MYALNFKKNDIPDIYFTILEATQIQPKFAPNAKTKDRGTLNPFKI